MRKSTSTNSANFISSSRATHSFRGSACSNLRSSVAPSRRPDMNSRMAPIRWSVAGSTFRRMASASAGFLSHLSRPARTPGISPSVTWYLLANRYQVTDGEMPGVLAGLDKWDRNPADAEAILRKVLPATDQRIGAILEFMSGLREGATELRRFEQAEPLNECVARLDEMKLAEFVEVDFRIVRGLAYYTGIVFELFDAKSSLRAICGGGRYDDLIEQVAGIDLPCVGFGMGDVVLGELLKEHGKQVEAPTELDAFLVAVGGEDVAPVVQLAAELRTRGVSVEYALHEQPIRKQLELAAARGAPRALILGPDERKAKVAIVRDLKTGRQKKVPLTKVRKGIFK